MENCKKILLLPVIVCSCSRCNWIWRAKIENPKYCPKCKSPFWDKKRRIKTMEKGVEKLVSNYGWETLEIGVEKRFPFPLLPDGHTDIGTSTRRSRSLEQYMRRHNYTYSWRGIAGDALYITRRT